MGPGNDMAAPSRASVRALGGELMKSLKGMGINVYTLSNSERDEFKRSLVTLQEDIVAKLGGDSKKIYDLILKEKSHSKKEAF